MKALFAFTKKEYTAHLRTGKLTILGLLFVLFGIMNPAVAKLTPWLLEVMAQSLEQSGMTVTVVTVTAMDSWVQFFKNIPMALIVFILMESSLFTGEYASGTLVLSLTKGLPRRHVVTAKATVALLLWTIGYWMCFGITYAYNCYYWDNAVAQNLWLSAVCWWVFGLWVTALMLFVSVIARTGTGVLLGTGGVVLASWLLGMFPKCHAYMPTYLTDGNSLIYGVSDPKDYLPALIITAVTAVLFLILSVPVFNRKVL